MPEPVLAFESFDYRYPDASGLALDALDLEVGAGEFVVLAGRSGSGKSTLLRAGCALVPHFHGGEVAGDVRVLGRSTRDCGPAELAGTVAFVAQEPESQVVSTTVRAELELPMELRGSTATETARAVEEAALALGIESLLERTTDSLSGGELQRVALGAALVTGPPLLLLDEPTSQLDPVAGDELISLLRRLNEEWGVAIVLGEHRLERCLAAADRVIALGHGRSIYDGPAEDFGRAALELAPSLATPVIRLFALAGLPGSPVSVKKARELVGEIGDSGLAIDLETEPKPPRAADSRARQGGGREGRASKPAPAMRCRRLRVELEAADGVRSVLNGIDLELRTGERVALMGPNGAGKTTLLRACAGLLEPSSGRIEVTAGCALLGQRPDDYLVRESVGEELPGKAGRDALAAVGLAVDPGTDPRDLSGGERQRLALAIALAGRGAGGRPAGLICLDEPTRGLDRARKDDLAIWIEQLAHGGAGVLVASHDVEFVARFATRVLLLARGRVIADGVPRDLLGGGWYFATEIARVTGGRAITPEEGAPLLAQAATTATDPEAVGR